MQKRPFKILIAPNALKGSLSAADAALAIDAGVREFDPEIETVCIPIADGGDGFLSAIHGVLKGEWITKQVEDPLGNSVNASFLYVPHKSLVIVELASAAGLALLTEEDYDIRKASTYGVGQLISEAFKLDIQRLILGVGGSATHDAGMGIACALGVDFLDNKGAKLAPCANNLAAIKHIDITHMNKKLSTVQIDVVCDVTNILLGDDGAAAVFAPQKGATTKDIVFLENGLSNFADVVQSDLNKNIRNLAGGGAAGGVGAGLSALFNANLCKGAELVFELLSIESEIKNVNLLITAEGKLDSQTKFGKAPFVVATLAKKYNIPVVLIVGQVEVSDAYYDTVFDYVIPLTSKNISIDYAINHVGGLIQAVTGDTLSKMKMSN